MENAKLRKQIEKLKSTERLFKLKREIALSPAEIKKAAKKLGLQTMTAKNIEVATTKKTTKKKTEKPKVEKDIALRLTKKSIETSEKKVKKR